MKKILYVKSSIFGDEGHSSKISGRLIDEIKAKYGDVEVTERDVIAEPLPVLDLEVLYAINTPAEERKPAQNEIAAVSDTLIDEIKDADIIIISAPTYNYSIPTQLKAWFDLLARSGVTFEYVEKGAVGLIDDKPVYLVTSRGWELDKEGIDFLTPFVVQFLKLIGLTSVHTILAEGLSFGDDSVNNAYSEADKFIAEVI